MRGTLAPGGNPGPRVVLQRYSELPSASSAQNQQYQLYRLLAHLKSELGDLQLGQFVLVVFLVGH